MKDKSKNFAILRFQKIKSRRSLRGALAHNLRVQDTPNANPELMAKNVIPGTLNSIDKCLGKFDGLTGKQKIRKNAVYGIEVVVTGSPEHMQKMSEKEQRQYFKDALVWLSKELGGQQNIISYVVHNDETTPHLQAIFAPVVDGKLNSKALLGGTKHRMTELQTNFANDVGNKYGLKRGVERSKARHQTIREYYSATKQVEPLKAEIEKLKLSIAHERENLDMTIQSNAENVRNAEIASESLTALTDALDNYERRNVGSVYALRDGVQDYEKNREKLAEVEPELAKTADRVVRDIKSKGCRP
ncbi:MobV family relaxase [Parashewanella curva]|nr:MobV family relaxase [Parashewanella curva]